MKLYQIVACTLMITFAMQSSFAATDIQIDFVKKMYQTGKQLEKGNELLELYADNSLQKAIDVWNSAEYCVGYDVMWQSNDPPYHRPLTFKNLGNSQIKVNLGKVKFYEASWVKYKLNCKGNSCKINDVIDNTGSLKKNIYEECRS